jgi:hypothetical protein
VVDPIIGKHGLSYRFRTTQTDKISVTCILSHKAGHSEETRLPAPPTPSGNKNAIQAIGSTLTYLQRYSLVQMLGLAAANDDDGKAAGAEPDVPPRLDHPGAGRRNPRPAPKRRRANCAAFLAWAKHKRIEDIPAEYFDSCIEKIKQVRSQPQMMKIIDCEQGSPEWFAARAGIPTASEFHTVMAVGPKGGKSVTRVDYLNKLAGEILTGEPMASYSNADMERGKLMEDEARDLYAFQTGAELQRVGFIRNGDKGASPDSLIGDQWRLGNQVRRRAYPDQAAARRRTASEHKAQVQGSIWVAEREWWDFISYCPKLPLFVKRVYRDEAYITKLALEVELFNAELQQTVEYIRRYGVKPHKVKTKADKAQKSKNYKVRAKHLGIKKKSGFRGWRKMNGSPVFAERER